jgi:hypothetical protein
MEISRPDLSANSLTAHHSSHRTLPSELLPAFVLNWITVTLAALKKKKATANLRFLWIHVVHKQLSEIGRAGSPLPAANAANYSAAARTE